MSLSDTPKADFLYLIRKKPVLRPLRDIADRCNNKRVMQRKAPKKKRGR